MLTPSQIVLAWTVDVMNLHDARAAELATIDEGVDSAAVAMAMAGMSFVTAGHRRGARVRSPPRVPAREAREGVS